MIKGLCNVVKTVEIVLYEFSTAERCSLNPTHSTFTIFYLIIFLYVQNMLQKKAQKLIIILIRFLPHELIYEHEISGNI